MSIAFVNIYLANNVVVFLMYHSNLGMIIGILDKFADEEDQLCIEQIRYHKYEIEQFNERK